MRPAEEVATTKLGITGNEAVEALLLNSRCGSGGDRLRPSSGQILIEPLRDAVVVATPPGSLNQTPLGLRCAVPVMQNPRHSHVVDVTDARAAKLLTLPAIRQLVIG